MHISEGILSGPVLLSGAAIAAAGTTVGLKKLDYDRIAAVTNQPTEWISPAGTLD